MINTTSNINQNNIQEPEFKYNFCYRENNNIAIVARTTPAQKSNANFTIINHPQNSDFSLSLITRQNSKDKLNLSQIAIRQTTNWFKSLDEKFYNDPSQLQKLWHDQLKNTARHMKNLQQSHRQSLKWGCMYTAVITTQDHLIVMHIGNSVIYAYDENQQFHKLTKALPANLPTSLSLDVDFNLNYIQNEIFPRQEIDSIFLTNNSITKTKTIKEVIAIANLGPIGEKELCNNNNSKKRINKL